MTASRTLPRHRARKVFVAAVASASMVVALGLVVASASAHPEGKVYVCKYVGTPGVDERLQTGQNPIEVSINAIKDYHGVGSYFADAQGRSYVLGEVPMDPEPTAADCPDGDHVIHSPTITGVAICVDPETSTYGVDYTIDTDGATGILSGTEPQDDGSLTAADFPIAGGSVTYSYSDGPDQTATYDEIALPHGNCAPEPPEDQPSVVLTQGDCDKAAFVTLLDPTDDPVVFTVNGVPIEVAAGSQQDVEVEFGEVIVTWGEDGLYETVAEEPTGCGAVEPWEPGWEPDDVGAVLPAGGTGTSPRVTTAFTGGELAGPTIIMGLLTLIGLGAVGLGRRHTVQR